MPDPKKKSTIAKKSRRKTKFVQAKKDVEFYQQNGGLSKSTRDRRRYNLDKLSNYVMLVKEMALDDYFRDLFETEEIPLSDLEEVLMGFFSSVKIEDPNNKEGELISPKLGTIAGYKTHFKMHIMKLSKGKVDITNKVVFEKFDVSLTQISSLKLFIYFWIWQFIFWKICFQEIFALFTLIFIEIICFQKFYNGFVKTELKANGLADTTHTRPLLPQTSLKIQKLLVVMTKLMKLEDRTGDAYEELQAELPPQYRDLWHELLPFGDLFIITMCTGRRGRQGLYEMKKDMFKIVEDDEHESGRKAFKQEYGELTKNQQMTDEDIRKGGSIPFEEMAETKLNPGEYHEEYLKTLHPECEKMFQKSKTVSSSFNLKSGEKVLFSLNGGKGMGESRVGQYMSMVRFAYSNKILLIMVKLGNKVSSSYPCVVLESQVVLRVILKSSSS